MNKEILRIRAEKAAAITLTVIIGAVGLKSCGPINGDKDPCSIEATRPASWFICPLTNLSEFSGDVEKKISEMSENIALDPNP